jgi:uncharacterized membrane protein YdjX (TVP38/TMEM64 family)
MKKIIENSPIKDLIYVIKENKLIFIYMLFTIVLPIAFSSGVVLMLQEYYWFFKSLKPLDLILIFVFLSFTMSLGITPTTFISFISGFLWGWMALIYIIPSYFFAMLLGYSFAKIIDNKKLIQTLRKLGKLPSFFNNLEQNSLKIVFLSRISPVLPFALMNVIWSVCQIKVKPFLVGGLLGMLPRTLIVIWLGTEAKSIFENPEKNWIFNLSLLLVAAGSLILLSKIVFKNTAISK